MFSENHAPANGEHGAPAHGGNVLALPNSPAPANALTLLVGAGELELQEVAPEAWSLDNAPAAVHLAMIDPRSEGDLDFRFHLFTCDDNLSRDDPRLRRSTVNSLFDVVCDIPIQEHVDWEDDNGQIVKRWMERLGFLEVAKPGSRLLCYDQ